MKKKIFIISNEASGNIIGTNLVHQFDVSQYIIKGIGGTSMSNAGVDIIFDYKYISVMGIIEVIFSLHKIIKYMNIASKEILKFNPDIIITIDAPSFNFRLIKKLKNKFKFTAIHYVAPTVWAYARNRVKIVQKLYEHILLILPFESQYFNLMKHTFVGHPIVEDHTTLLFKTKNIFNIDMQKLNDSVFHISIMVGSRIQEIKRHTKIVIEWIVLMQNFYSTNNKELHFYFLTLPHLKHDLELEIKKYIKNINNIHICENMHNQIMQKSVLGIVKSGTATMQFMANALPAITFYKVSFVTALIMKCKLKIKKFNLCNLITNSENLPELIQNKFTATNLFEKSIELLSSSRNNILDCYLHTWKILQQSELPSKKAARVILEYLNS